MLLYGLKVRGCCAALKPFVHVTFEFQKIAKVPKTVVHAGQGVLYW